jgi:ABC-2 type transport system ATP-binding protein
MTDSEISRKTDEVLRDLDMEALRHTMVKSIPLGWKQKLAFSVSIFHEPGIVFLDEPTGGVDAATRKQFWKLIYQAAGRGITVFVTTHYMDSRILRPHLDHGRRKISAIARRRTQGALRPPDMDGVFT